MVTYLKTLNMNQLSDEQAFVEGRISNVVVTEIIDDNEKKMLFHLKKIRLSELPDGI